MGQATEFWMEKANQICFSNPKPATTDHGRHYHYRSLKLSEQTGIPNVITRAGKDSILIGTENGKILLINLKSNRLKAYLSVDPWLSSVVSHRSVIWSVGTKKEGSGTCVRSNRQVANFQLQPSNDKYSVNGVQIKPTKSPSFYLHNSGGLSFTVMSLQTRKPIRRFDLEHILQKQVEFAGIRQRDRVRCCMCVSTKSSKLFVIVNRKDPHLVIFDYKRMEVLNFEPLLAPGDKDKYTPVTAILSKGPSDDYFAVVTQLKDKERRLIRTIFKFYGRDILSPGHRQIATMPCPSRFQI